MIYYHERKDGRKSIFSKVITDENDHVLSKREVEISLIKLEEHGKTWFMLYDDDMNILDEPTSYLNFDMAEASLNTRRNSANALRLLYVFLALSNYQITHIEQRELSELIHFLRGINSNPTVFKTKTVRSNDTVNSYLGVYREFFRRRKIYSNALFDSKVTRRIVSFDNDITSNVAQITYSSNLPTYNPETNMVPMYISPDEFEKLNRKAIEKNDKRALCIMRLMYCYGLRLGEVLGLTTEDLKESHRDNTLVPIIVIRNRISDKDFQFAKNLCHVDKPETYRSKLYSRSKYEIVIDYPLYELICDYITEVHTGVMENHPDRYAAGEADIVSWRDAPESNHYIFLSNKGSVLSGQTWGNYLKKYFEECDIPIDRDCRGTNLSHRFRHGFAMLHAHYRKDPVNALELQKMMRHASLSSTMRYYNPTLEEEFKIKEEFTEELFELIPSLKEGGSVFE